MRELSATTRAIRVWVQAHPGCTAGRVSRALGLDRQWVQQALDVGAISGRMWALHVGPPPPPCKADAPVWVSTSDDDVQVARDLTVELVRLQDAAGVSDETLRARMYLPSTRYFGRWRRDLSLAVVVDVLRWARAVGYTVALVPIRRAHDGARRR